MRAACRLEDLEVVLQQLDLATHDREHVVEVVRDATGQAADRLHLLRVEQLLLERLPFGHVAEHDHLELGRGVEAAQARLADLHPHRLASGVDQPGLARLVRPGDGRARTDDVVLPGVLGPVGAQVGAHQRVVGLAQQRAQRPVGLDDPAVEAGDRHGDRRVVEGAAEPLGGGGTRGLGVVTLVERQRQAQHGEERDGDEHLQDRRGVAPVDHVRERSGGTRRSPVGRGHHHDARPRHAAGGPKRSAAHTSSNVAENARASFQ